jgi:hypothetical protein
MLRKTATALVALLMLGLAAGTALGVTEHCPGEPGDNPSKVEATPETQDEINALVLDAGTVFCVKAGPFASGDLVADGVTSLLGYVTWTNNGGQTPDVSYYINHPPASPTPSPSEEPTPEPSVEPTPDPSVEPTPDPSVAPSEDPTPAPSSGDSSVAVTVPNTAMDLDGTNWILVLGLALVGIAIGILIGLAWASRYIRY